MNKAVRRIDLDFQLVSRYDDDIKRSYDNTMTRKSTKDGFLVQWDDKEFFVQRPNRIIEIGFV